MEDEDQFDGTIIIKRDPRRDLQLIETLPPAEQQIAIYYEMKLFPYELERIAKSLEKIIQILDINTHPIWPRTKKTWKEWGVIWRAISREKKEIENYYNNGGAESKFVSAKEYSEYISNELSKHGYKGKNYSPRYIREIIKAGEAGYLKKGYEGIKS